MRQITFASLLALAFGAHAGSVAADPAYAGAPAGSGTQVRLIPGWRLSDGTRLAAIEIRLAPGWHTYWRVPGDAGIPPTFDWSGSTNLASVAYEWPRPERFESAGMETFGYERGLVLPVRLKPADAAAPMVLTLDADFGVCADICMAADADLTLTLAPDTPEEGRDEIEAALADRPRSAAEAGVLRVTCAVTQGAGGTEISAAVTFAGQAGPYLVAAIETGQPDVWIGVPESRTSGRVLTASAPMETLGQGGPMLARRDLRMTLLGAADAVDIRGCDAPG